MGIDLSLRREDGQELATLADPRGILRGLLPVTFDPARPFLSTIDPWGDTVFNPMQAKRLLEEWPSLRERARSADENRFLDEAGALITQCAGESLVHLWFVGD